MLSHTVFTLNYMHHLADIETDTMFPVFLSENDPERPIELITTILRPCVQGLVKSIDLTWREMHNNDLIEDVSLPVPCPQTAVLIHYRRKIGRVINAKCRSWKMSQYNL